jgi:cardiolipin synthase
VDVRVLTSGLESDVKTTWYAGRAYYEELVSAGVRIYEYEPTMMHAKTLVADGVWVSIGSMNFDNRSMAFNNETSLVAVDSAIGVQMDSVFLRDLTYSREITLPEFRKRGALEKTIEWCAEKLWRIL